MLKKKIQLMIHNLTIIYGLTNHLISPKSLQPEAQILQIPKQGPLNM